MIHWDWIKTYFVAGAIEVGAVVVLSVFGFVFFVWLFSKARTK